MSQNKTESAVSEQTTYKGKIATWKSSFVLPNIRLARVNEIQLPNGREVCTEYKTEHQCLYLEAFIRVTVSKPCNLQAIVDDCLKPADVAAAISEMIKASSSGKTALAAAKDKFRLTFQDRLLSKLESNDLIELKLDDAVYWGEWE